MRTLKKQTRSIREKLATLSDEAKGWLHRTCNQLADTGEYCSGVGKKECIKVGVIEDKKFGRIEVSEEVMHLVYSCNVLDAFKDK